MRNTPYGIMDFVAPTENLRNAAHADFIIFMDTKSKSRYEDTNKMFERPVNYDVRIAEWIGLDQLRNSLEDFSPGIQGIQSFLKEPLVKLAK